MGNQHLSEEKERDRETSHIVLLVLVLLVLGGGLRRVVGLHVVLLDHACRWLCEAELLM